MLVSWWTKSTLIRWMLASPSAKWWSVIRVPATSSSTIRGWWSTTVGSMTAPGAATTSPHFLIVLVPHFCHTLAEIDLDSSIINESTVHFEISFHALFFARKLTKCVLQRGARIGIANNFHFYIWVKPRKYQFQIFILCDWIQLAHKQDFLGCLYI
jgi:hypothetical protein